jgi:hypothetical protein
VLVEAHILRRRGASSKWRALLVDGSILLRRGVLDSRWRAHSKGGYILVLSYCLSRGAFARKRGASLREGASF